MRNYTYGKYSELVENSKLPELQAFMKDEFNLLSKVKDSKAKTFIDLGAGYGRVIPFLCEVSKNVVAIEINPEMMKELARRVNDNINSVAFEGNILATENLLEGREISNPVMCLLQNTLGTLESAHYKEVIAVMKKIAIKYDGEVVLSLFCQEGLRKFGMQLYSSTAEMTGEPDVQKTNFENGLMITKTGYTSKWWTPEEREEIKRFFGGKIVNEVLTENYNIFDIKV